MIFGNTGVEYPESLKFARQLGADPFYHCNPLSIWTDEDIWEYIHRYSVPTSPLYDMGYTDSKGVFHRIQRNGCFGCATGILYKNNQMSMLRHTHPKIWEAVMNYGMADELKKLYHSRSVGLPSVIDIFTVDELLEHRPCAFDDFSEAIDGSGINDEYDPED